MNVRSQWKIARDTVARLMDAFCAARDAQRGTAWERLSVAYPDPREARRAVELFQLTRLPVSAAAG